MALKKLRSSGPQPFRHQGSVPWKPVFTRAVGCRGMVQAVMLRVVVGCSRRCFAHWPTTHLLLCGPVPNRPQTGTSSQPRDGGPLLHRTAVPSSSGEIPPPSASGRRQNLGLVGVWCLVAWASALSSLQHTLSCHPCCTVPLSIQMCSHSAQCKAEPVTCLSSPTWSSLVAQLLKNPPAMQKAPIRFPSQEDPLEKG